MANALWHEIGQQFRRPNGTYGRVMGHVMRVINARPYQHAIAALAPQPHDTILELGCGPGAGISQLLRDVVGVAVHGLDQSDVMISQASVRNARAVKDGRVSLHQAGFHSIPIPAGSVDRILAVNVAYFWQDAAAVLGELRRVLKPGGSIVIYVTDEEAMKRWRFAGSDTHLHYNETSLRDLLRQGPFSQADIVLTKVKAGFGVPGLVAVIHDVQRPTTH